MEFIPIGLLIFKVVVLGTGMFLAVRWHYEQDKKTQKAGVISAVGKMAAVLALLLMCLLFATFTIATKIGLDLSLAQ